MMEERPYRKIVPKSPMNELEDIGEQTVGQHDMAREYHMGAA